MTARVGALVVAAAVVLAAACSPRIDDSVSIEVWFHRQEGEARAALEALVEEFTAGQDKVTVLVRVLSDAEYDGIVEEAAKVGELPDLLTVDPGAFDSYVADGWPAPLDDLLDPADVAGLRPWAASLGQRGGELRGIPTSAEPVLLAVDRTVVGTADTITIERLAQALATAASTGGSPVLGLGLDADDPAGDPAFSRLLALLASAGVTDTVGLGEGGLDGPEATNLWVELDRWAREGWLDINAGLDEVVGGDAVAAFVSSSAVADAQGDLGDVVLLPPPDVGGGPRPLLGSHLWVIPDDSEVPDAAASFLSFLLQPSSLARLAGTARVPVGDRSSPGAPSVIATVAELYGAGAGVTRPATPGYADLAAAVRTTLDAVVDGGGVRRALDALADDVGGLDLLQTVG